MICFQNILENIKDETVKQDLLTGNNGAVQLTHDELAQLSHFSKMVSPKRRVEEGKPLFEVTIAFFIFYLCKLCTFLT